MEGNYNPLNVQNDVNFKNGKLFCLLFTKSDNYCSILLNMKYLFYVLFSSFNASLGLKGNVWLARYNKSKDRSVKRLFVPKELQKDSAKFETFLDRQSGEDSNFRIRSRMLWLDFVRSEEDRLHDAGNSVRFTMVTATGIIS